MKFQPQPHEMISCLAFILQNSFKDIILKVKFNKKAKNNEISKKY